VCVSVQIVTLLLKYSNLSFFSNVPAVRHFGFVGQVLGQPTKSIWWSLSLCKIWLELHQSF